MMNTLDERTIAHQLAGMVAAELPDGWTVDTSDDFAEHRAAYLDGPHGERLSLSLDWRNNDRITISGVYPRHSKYGVERHEIGVGRDRGPAVIAREITRRLLPAYEKDLADVFFDNAERVGNAAARQKLAGTIAELVGGTIDAEGDDSSSTQVRWYSDNGYGHVRISYRADSISEVEIRSASTKAVLAALRAFKAAQS